MTTKSAARLLLGVVAAATMASAAMRSGQGGEEKKAIFHYKDHVRKHMSAAGNLPRRLVATAYSGYRAPWYNGLKMTPYNEGHGSILDWAESSGYAEVHPMFTAYTGTFEDSERMGHAMQKMLVPMENGKTGSDSDGSDYIFALGMPWKVSDYTVEGGLVDLFKLEMARAYYPADGDGAGGGLGGQFAAGIPAYTMEDTDCSECKIMPDGSKVDIGARDEKVEARISSRDYLFQKAPKFDGGDSYQQPVCGTGGMGTIPADYQNCATLFLMMVDHLDKIDGGDQVESAKDVCDLQNTPFDEQGRAMGEKACQCFCATAPGSPSDAEAFGPAKQRYTQLQIPEKCSETDNMCPLHHLVVDAHAGYECEGPECDLTQTDVDAFGVDVYTCCELHLQTCGEHLGDPDPNRREAGLAQGRCPQGYRRVVEADMYECEGFRCDLSVCEYYYDVDAGYAKTVDPDCIDGDDLLLCCEYRMPCSIAAMNDRFEIPSEALVDARNELKVAMKISGKVDYDSGAAGTGDEDPRNVASKKVRQLEKAQYGFPPQMLPHLCDPQKAGTTLRLPGQGLATGPENMVETHGGMSSLGAVERSDGDELFCQTADCSEEGAKEFCCIAIECDDIENCLGDTKCTTMFDELPSDSNPITAVCDICTDAFHGAQCDNECIRVENALVTSTYRCTNVHDTTMVEGGCIDAHFYKQNDGGADECLPCDDIPNCQMDRVSCVSATKSVCAMCLEGFSGSRCTHKTDDAACSYAGEAYFEDNLETVELREGALTALSQYDALLVAYAGAEEEMLGELSNQRERGQQLKERMLLPYLAARDDVINHLTASAQIFNGILGRNPVADWGCLGAASAPAVAGLNDILIPTAATAMMPMGAAAMATAMMPTAATAMTRRRLGDCMIQTIRCEDCGGNRGNANREDVEVFAKGANMIAFSELRDEWSPAIDALEGEVKCRCDDGTSGDKCEIKATCPEYTAWKTIAGAFVASGCSAEGKLGGSRCTLGCEAGFYQVVKSDGLCLAIPNSGNAEYQDTGITCEACAHVDHCLGDITCNPDGSVCSRCAPGYHGDHCQACPAGSVTDLEGNCNKCEVGTYSALESGRECKTCVAGKAAIAPGMQGCQPCMRGEFAAADGASECVECPSGKVSKTTASTECETCPDGKYGAVAGGGADCHDCHSVHACASEITCTGAFDSACSECKFGYHIANMFQCEKCQPIENCAPDTVSCTGTTDSTCGECFTGYFIDRQFCTQCQEVDKCLPGKSHCTMGPPAGDSDAVCDVCIEGWQGSQCDIRVMDEECFKSGAHFITDGSLPIDNCANWRERIPGDGRGTCTAVNPEAVGHTAGCKAHTSGRGKVKAKGGTEAFRLAQVEMQKQVEADCTADSDAATGAPRCIWTPGKHTTAFVEGSNDDGMSVDEIAAKAAGEGGTDVANESGRGVAGTKGVTLVGAAQKEKEDWEIPCEGVRTAYDFQECQWQCQATRKKTGIRAQESCFLFSYNQETKECRLQTADAGAMCPEKGETEDTKKAYQECYKQAKKDAQDDDFMALFAEQARFTDDPAWVSGPKWCYRASCDELYGSDMTGCGEGWSIDKENMMRQTSNTKCAADVCTLAADQETCCVPAKCGNWECPAYHVPKFGVADQECGMHNDVPHCRNPVRAMSNYNEDGTASDDSGDGNGTTDAWNAMIQTDDQDLCCDPNEMCIELECPYGMQHMTEGIHVSKKPCAGAKCSVDTDALTCCEPLARCKQDYECPVNQKTVDRLGNVRFVDFVKRPNAADLYCAGDVCEDSHDRDTCCAQRDECANLDCRGESADAWTNSAYAIKTEIACAGFQCDFEVDRDTCCFRRMHCGTMVSNGDGGMCREGWADREDPSTILCDGGSGVCDPRVDTETCCLPQETCDEMAPILFDCGGLNKHFTKDCDMDCVKERCDAEPTCAWTVGPKGFANEHYGGRDEDDQDMWSGMCGYKECHREWDEGCVCPSGIDEWDEPEQMEGGFFKAGTAQKAIDFWGWKGTAEDFEKDCIWQEEEVCTMKESFTEMEVNGASKRKSVFGDDSHADAAEDVGAQGGPAMSDSHDAIFSSSSGGGAPVIEGVNDAATLAANGGLSKGAVESTGGEFESTGEFEANNEQGEVQQLNAPGDGSGPEGNPRQGRRATSADVDPSAPKPDWADAGPMQATSILKTEMNCVKKHDIPMMSGSALSEKCPEAYVSIKDPTDSFCANGYCTVELDQDVCCQPRATCDTLMVPNEWALKADAASMLCRLEVCSPDDRILKDGTFAQADNHICAELRATCDNLTCPEGQTWANPGKEEIVAAEAAVAAAEEQLAALTAANEEAQSPFDADAAKSHMTPREIEKAIAARPALMEEAAALLEQFTEGEYVEVQAALVAAQEASAEVMGLMLCATGTCNQADDSAACCSDCPPGRATVEGSFDGLCHECPMNTRSAEGFNGYGSDECFDCGAGKYADAGADHCLACNPIFACAVKVGMTQEVSKTAIEAQNTSEFGDFAATADARAGGVEAWPATLEGKCVGGTSAGNVPTKMACMGAAISAGGTYFSVLAKDDGSFDCESAVSCDDRSDKDSQWRVHEQPEGSTGLTDDDERIDMAAALDETLAELAAAGRRMAFAMEAAGNEAEYADSEAAGVTCNDGASSVCVRCVIGYRGSGSSKCSKCGEIDACKYPRGNAKGPSCSQDDSGNETELKCGECKTGFFGDLCEACDSLEGCETESCEAAGASSCLKCESGYFLKDDGQCETCNVIDQCLDTVCDSADASHCEMCDNGFFTAGPECAKLEFDELTGTWTAVRSNGNVA